MGTATTQPPRGMRTIKRAGHSVIERTRMTGNRLTVILDYEGARGADTVAWQLYAPGELIALARQRGMTCRVACSRFDETYPPAPSEPRMQLVFEKLEGP